MKVERNERNAKEGRWLRGHERAINSQAVIRTGFKEAI
jgi:hypothetical protein